jgi:thiosulfate dehydrogenase [quinone] large subunit
VNGGGDLEISNWKKLLLVVLRFAVGWHFFYQGFGKLTWPYWTAEGYLNASWGPFEMIAENPTLLLLADYAMMWGLLLIGLMLMIGLFTRIAAIAGICLLGLIFVAVPPLDYTGFIVSTTQGTELYVDKNLIEILALALVASFDTGRMLGLDILVDYWRKKA